MGASCRSATRAAPAGMIVMSRAGSENGTSAMPRRSASALAINSSAALTRESQFDAALQPSSNRIINGALLPARLVCGFQIGPAAARMTSAAAASRSTVSHHGVREGVSSFGAMSNNSRVGGNSMRRGRGGKDGPELGRSQRFGEGEGEASDHALRPTLTPARAVPLLTIIPPCRNSSNSAAERLVVWVANSQSSLLVSSRIWSRCSATRAT